MNIQSMERELSSGKTIFITDSGEQIRVNIQCSGLGGRYQAFVETPFYNTMINTPESVNTEGPLSFYSRLAPRLVEIMADIDTVKNTRA